MIKTEKADELYYLRDSRSDTGSSAMFWATGGGYTTDLNRAAKFTRESAVGQYHCRETDIPLRCDLIDPLSYLAVDSQYIKDSYEPDPKGEYVAQIKARWDGNNIYFFTAIAQPHLSVDFSKAEVFDIGSSHILSHLRLIPRSEMEKLARPVVNSQKINNASLLRKCNIKVIKIKRQRPTTGMTRHNCPECKKFVWDYNPYDAPLCKNCR